MSVGDMENEYNSEIGAQKDLEKKSNVTMGAAIGRRDLVQKGIPKEEQDEIIRKMREAGHDQEHIDIGFSQVGNRANPSVKK